MTLAELQTRMSAQEFELWVAREQLKGDQCPNCGVEPRDMMDWTVVAFYCPVCKYKGHKVHPWGPSSIKE